MNASQLQPRFTPSDDCAFYATELFAIATSPLSIDVLVVGSVKMQERAELRSAQPASLAPFLVAAHI
ncbi:hypothetical protein V499_04946 [Pseudogymnoascus sp. VKM F-103]|nr:hypothetical protein V499_04946 [Pseudogymnoascus sp. VKM F-103]